MNKMPKILKYIFSLCVFCISLTDDGVANTFVVSTSGLAFSPSVITIYKGDTVQFQISSIHNAVEVSKAVYNANGITSNGGFSTPFGGGKVAFKTSGTFYYVCTNHVSSGMKGIVNVLEHPCTSYVFDTLKVTINDTIQFIKYDTIYTTIDSLHIPVFDTIPIYSTDTLHVTINDTIPVFSTDTIHIQVYDTIPVFYTDTMHVIVNDTLFINDTINVVDTIYNVISDTVFYSVPDTIFLVSSNGIFYRDNYNEWVGAMTMGAKQIMLEKLKNFILKNGKITDVTGKLVKTLNENDFEGSTIQFSKSGVYFILLEITNGGDSYTIFKKIPVL